MSNRKLAVFCGSKPGNDPAYSSTCKTLARVMHEHNLDLVYGGGRIGLMGVLADELLSLDGKVYGVIPQKLMDLEVGHQGITKLTVVDTMHERKAQMAQMADGFLALPGGIGTLEEIIEVFTWQQIGYHNKPCAFLNTLGYYNDLIQFIEKMVTKGFLSAANRDRLIVEASPDELISRLFHEIG